MQELTPILKSTGKRSFRVLRPSEYEALKDAATKYRIKGQMDLMLMTGMRYSELREFRYNRQWFENENTIHVPEHKIERQKRGVMERYVRLSYLGQQRVAEFLSSQWQLAAYSNVFKMLKLNAKRSSVSPESLSAKVFRKTYESWLIYSYPERTLEILLSTGHTEKTALQHYLNVPFNEDDKRGMRKYVEGW